MNTNELLNKYVYDQNKNILPYGYYIWKSLLANLEKKFEELGFLEAYINNSYVNDLSLSEAKYQMLNMKIDDTINHVSISEYDNMIEGAKTSAIDILQAYVMTIKNSLSINVLTGKEVSFDGEEKYILGSYIPSVGFMKYGEVAFYQYNDKYRVKSYLSNIVLDAFVSINQDEEGIIASPISSMYQISIIPLKMNEANVLSYARKLKSRLESIGNRVYLNENRISEKDKLQEAKKVGSPLIIEVGPRDILNKKIEVLKRTDSVIMSIDEDKIENYITNFYKKINVDLINRQVKNLLLNSKNALNKEELIEGLNAFNIINITFDGTKETYDSIQALVNNAYIYFPFNQELFSEVDVISKRKSKYVLTICKKNI